MSDQSITTTEGPRGWLVVAGAVIGVACGATVLAPYTFGYLTGPLAREMGWTRAELAPAISGYMLVLLALLPVAGAVTDRIGARRAAAIALGLMGLVMVAAPLLIGSLAGLYAAYVLLAVAAVCASPVSFARAVTAWFDRRRGLALGLALSGVGLGTALLPPLVRALVETGGWQAGYYGLGGLLLCFAAPAVWLTVNDTPPAGPGAPAVDPAERRRGAREALGEAVKGGLFWRLAFSFFLLGVGISGAVPFMPSILEGRGVDTDVAVKIQVCLGISAIVGRVAGGWMMDRVFAPIVTAIAAAAAIAGLLLLLQVGTWGLLAAVVGVCFGLATGMEGDVIAYLSSRYFRRQVFSTVLSVMLAVYLAGAALGPTVLALGERVMGDGVFMVLAGLLVVAAVVQLLLGPYRHVPAGKAH